SMYYHPVIARQMLGCQRRPEILIAGLHLLQHRRPELRCVGPVRHAHAAVLSLLLPDIVPTSVSFADNSTPATPPLRAPANCAPSPDPSLPLDSALSCSIPFSPISVPPRTRNSKREHF